MSTPVEKYLSTGVRDAYSLGGLKGGLKNGSQQQVKEVKSGLPELLQQKFGGLNKVKGWYVFKLPKPAGGSHHGPTNNVAALNLDKARLRVKLENRENFQHEHNASKSAREMKATETETELVNAFEDDEDFLGKKKKKQKKTTTSSKATSSKKRSRADVELVEDEIRELELVEPYPQVELSLKPQNQAEFKNRKQTEAYRKLRQDEADLLVPGTAVVPTGSPFDNSALTVRYSNTEALRNSYVLFLPTAVGTSFLQDEKDGSGVRGGIEADSGITPVLCPTRVKGVFQLGRQMQAWGGVAGGELGENIFRAKWGGASRFSELEVPPRSGDENLAGADDEEDEEDDDDEGHGDERSGDARLKQGKGPNRLRSCRYSDKNINPAGVFSKPSEKLPVTDEWVPLEVLPPGEYQENVLPLATMLSPIEIDSEFVVGTKFRRVDRGINDRGIEGAWTGAGERGEDEENDMFPTNPIEYRSNVDRRTAPVTKLVPAKELGYTKAELKAAGVGENAKLPTTKTQNCIYVGALVDMEEFRKTVGDVVKNVYKTQNNDNSVLFRLPEHVDDAERYPTNNPLGALKRLEKDHASSSSEETFSKYRMYLFPVEQHALKAGIAEKEEALLSITTNPNTMTITERQERMLEFHSRFSAAKRLRKIKNSKGKEISDNRMEGDLEEIKERLRQDTTHLPVENPHIANAKLYLPTWETAPKDKKHVFKKGLAEAFPPALIEESLTLPSTNSLVKELWDHRKSPNDTTLREVCGCQVAYDLLRSKRLSEATKVKTKKEAEFLAKQAALVRILLTMYKDKSFSFAGPRGACRNKFKVFDEGFTGRGTKGQKGKGQK